MKSSEKLVKEALESVRQNITDHVFLEIQRDVKLFRSYVRLVANGDDESKYGEINREIAQLVENMVGIDGKARVDPNCVLTPMSTLIQSFSCFVPETVCVMSENTATAGTPGRCASGRGT